MSDLIFDQFHLQRFLSHYFCTHSFADLDWMQQERYRYSLPWDCFTIQMNADPCDIHEMSMWVPEQTSCQQSRQTKFYFLWLGTTGQPMSPSLSYPITFGSTQGNWLQHWLFSILVGCMNNWPIWCPEFNSPWKHHSTVISHERPVCT